LLIALGLAMRTLARGDNTMTAAGTFFIYYGIYYVVRPALLLGLTLFRRRGRVGADGGEIALELDERGLRLTDASSTSRVGWDVISAGGARPGYAWVEIRGGSRLAIPRRAFDDFDAFEELFRERNKWRA
ncbi:MAG TPA: YcxB family protein, partial [Polyangiaceae bacterium]|nr:YcxB family protein [Polyangiaceae bacterium]